MTKEEEEASRIRAECEMAFERLMPALNEAIGAIKAVPKEDISEIKAMKKPPKIIKLILKAMCIIFQIQPIQKKIVTDICEYYKPSYQLAAHGKDLLGCPTLP